MARISHVKAKAAKLRNQIRVIEVPPDSERDDGSNDGTKLDEDYPNNGNSTNANHQLHHELEQQQTEPLPAADKSARIMNNAFQSQSGHNPVQLPATSSSPLKRRSERLVEGPASKSHFVGIESENGIHSSQPPAKPNNGRLKRPTRRPEPSGTKTVSRRTGRNHLDMAPDPPEHIATDTTWNISATEGVESVVDGTMGVSVAPAEARTDEDLADLAEVEDGPTDGNLMEPSTPRRRGRPRKPISEKRAAKRMTPKKPVGRPPKRRYKKHGTESETPAPSGQTANQGREESPTAQDIFDHPDQQPTYAQSLVSPAPWVEQPMDNPQELSVVVAGTGVHATSGSQTRLPDRSKETGVSEQPQETTRDPPDGQTSGGESEAGGNDNYTHSNASEERGSDDYMDSSGIGHEVWADAADADIQPQTVTGPELFNQEHSLSRILKAARKIGKLRTDSAGKRKKITVNTQAFKTFMNRIKEASTCYRTLARYTDTDEEAEPSIESRLKAHLEWLHGEVGALSELQAGNKPRVMVKDIYANAIPQMVFLLRDAFKARSPSYSDVTKTRALREIIRLLEITETLCEKARNWSVKPNTQLPIVEPTSKVIYPCIRGMVSVFQGELDDRLEVKQRARMEKGLPMMHLQKKALWQKKHDQAERKMERWCRDAGADVQKMASGRALVRSSRPRPQQVLKQDQWSNEQSNALLTMLESPVITTQPLEQRYISALNTPLLQNKLPEHIERQAMALKPIMQRTYMEYNMPIPEWVSSLQFLTAVHPNIP